MITGLRYTNSAGKVFDFDQQGVHPRFQEAFDWEADVLELNGNVAAYTRDAREIEVGCTFTRFINRAQVMDALYNIAAYDLANNTNGQLSVGDWSIPCALTKSSKSYWWRGSSPVDYALTFRSAQPFWTRTLTYQFFPVAEAGSALDYEHDYPFDYGGNGQTGEVSSGSVYPSDFLLRIYGPATNPYVIIGDNRYEVDITVPDGGLLVIDSAAGIVELTTVVGLKSNEFDNTPDASSGSGEYIFEQIPTGLLPVSWDGTFGFDLLIYERRDERVWS